MEHDDHKRPRPVRVTDRRIGSAGKGEESPSPGNENPEFAGEDVGAPEAPTDATSTSEDREETVPLDDFLRLQADFDNRRKRMMRETAMASSRAKREMFENLLPVLDNFDRAISHAEDASGLEIVQKDLLGVLARDGLEEIPAEGQPFDYHLHHAIAKHEDPAVAEETVAEVLLKGYRLGDDVIRHAGVVVAVPEASQVTHEPDDTQAEG